MVIFLALLTLTLAALLSPVELSVTATGQETICFNYHPEAETFAFSYDVTLPLLFDPINSLSVMAKIVQDEDEDDGRITDVTVKSPGGTGFSIGLNEFVKPHNSDKREMKHGAVMYETDGLTVAYSREVDQFQVFMSNGFSFTVYRKVDHLDVAINNSNGVSEKVSHRKNTRFIVPGQVRVWNITIDPKLGLKKRF